MRALIIGVGAAGNKAAIELEKHHTIPKNDIVLINSTLKDIPVEYHDIAIEIEGPNGCGQERSLAKDIILKALKNEHLQLDSMMDTEQKKVIIIASLCGATGSGMAPVIAKYFDQVVGIHTEIIGLVGFEDESPRALRNIMEFCQDLEESFTIQLVRNSAFLKDTAGNRSKAEHLANIEVVKRIKLMLGTYMIDSTQNIDETDIMKLNNASGYKTVEFIPVNDKIKNTDQFNSYLKEMLDETKSVESDGSKIGLLGVITNLQPSSQEFIDRSYKTIIEKLGQPYEVYTHIQYTENCPEFIGFIASGMKMPEDQIRKLYSKYIEMTESVNKARDNFFTDIQELKGGVEDLAFDKFEKGAEKRSMNSDSEAKKERNKFFMAFEDEEAVDIPKGISAKPSKKTNN